MRNNFSKIILAVAFGLAMALTLSCSSGGDDNNNSGDDGGGSSWTPKCDGQDYDPQNQRCKNNVVETKCGADNWYNASTQFCYANNTVYYKCSGSNYDPSTRYCSNGTMREYGFVTYEGQTYKTVVIGSQTWMAENLNYAAEGSKCGDGGGLSDANTSICDVYGRLYNWVTAMVLPSNDSPFGLLDDGTTDCNRWLCSSQIGAKHQGVCPSGWHIPSENEWEALIQYVDPNCSDRESVYCENVGTKLKAASGWKDWFATSDNGTDDYGFAALPGGSARYNSPSVSWNYSGGQGLWWSASQMSDGIAASRMDISAAGTFGNTRSDKPNLYSVRCLQD